MYDQAEPQHDSLADALASHGIGLPPDQIAQLDDYRQRMWAWNERMNLTRHTTLEKFVTRDLVDSLELSKLLDHGERVLDVGSGGGVPGIVLAIVRPDLRMSLCESVQKKAGALADMVEGLGVNTPVYATRVDDLLEAYPFDTLVARAVAPMKKMLRWLEPRWESFDRLLLVKGRAWVDERGEARHLGLLRELELRKAAEYTTPRADAVSVILSLTRKDDAEP